MGLEMVRAMSRLPFGALMAVYEQSNGENAREQWPNLSEMEALYRAEMEFYQYLRQDFFTTGEGMYALWREKGTIVSALRLEPWRDGWLLEGLETHPAHRGKGYATQLMTAALADLPGKVYSHVARKNKASLAVHEKTGFREAEDTPLVDGSYLPGFVTLVREG